MDKTKAVRLTDADQAVVEVIQRRLGTRNTSEVLRMGLRSLAREQNLENVYHEEQAAKIA
jgi:hypothetical protein